MLTNMENQLREQGAEDRMDEVLLEIPKVRKDLGYIPLVTPTSQIVGTQSVINVLSGERYKSITKETAAVLKGEYGLTPDTVNAELQAKVLDGKQPITCRPADLIDDEMDALIRELVAKAKEDNIELASGENQIDDVLTYALFPQIGLKFLKNRDNPAAFEPVPTGNEANTVLSDSGDEVYTVTVEGQSYTVTVNNGGDLTGIISLSGNTDTENSSVNPPAGNAHPVPAPLAGNIVKILVKSGQRVNAGDKILILEAMKMETDVTAPCAGEIQSINIREGDSVAVGDLLTSIR